MANFGNAIYGVSKFGKTIVVFDSQAHPGCRYEFSYAGKKALKNDVVNYYYQCISCRDLKETNSEAYEGKNVPKITVSQNILKTNPDNPQNGMHFCQGVTLAKSLAVQIDREARGEAKRGVKRPHQAFEEAESSIQRRLTKYI